MTFIDSKRITPETEIELIKAAKDGCSDSLNQLFVAHYPFFLKQCNRYVKARADVSNPAFERRVIFEIEDLLSICFIQMRRAVEMFELRRGVRFLSFCGKYVWRWFRTSERLFIKSESFYDTESFDLIPRDSDERSLEQGEFQEYSSQIIRRAIARIPERRVRQIIRLRFFNDPPLKLHEIGERFALSKERIRQLELIGKKKIKAYLQSFPELTQLFDQ